MEKGFTLIELLAVIVILAVISVVTIPRLQEVLFESQDNTYNLLVTRFENKANDYIADYNLSNQVITGVPLDIYISDLIEQGYIEEDELEDPRDAKKTIQKETSYIRFTLENGVLNYKAHIVVK
jgi:type IV pilus assembly protein PilA